MRDARRYFVVTLGRSGSSLLSAILADAGADFGMPVPAHWDPRRGVLEHPAMKRAAHHMRAAHDHDRGERHLLSPRLEAKLRRRAARKYLRRALASVSYVKIGDLDLLVQLAFALGFEPRVIVSFRRLEDILASMLIGRKHAGPDSLARDYVRVYRQGLALMQVFGGCAIGYELMTGGEDARWLDALAAVTELDRDLLARAALRRIERRPEPDAEPSQQPVYPEAQAVFDALKRVEGRACAPVGQVRRALEARAKAR